MAFGRRWESCFGHIGCRLPKVLFGCRLREIPRSPKPPYLLMSSTYSPWSLSSGAFELPRSRRFTGTISAPRLQSQLQQQTGSLRPSSRSSLSCSGSSLQAPSGSSLAHSVSSPAMLSPVTGHMGSYLAHARTTKPTLSKLSSPHLASSKTRELPPGARRKALFVSMHRPHYHVALSGDAHRERSPDVMSAMLPRSPHHGRRLIADATDPRLLASGRPPSPSYIDFERPSILTRFSPSQPTEIIETEDGPVLRIKKEELSTYVNSAALHAIARPADYGTGAFFEGEFNYDQRASSSTFDTQIFGQGTSYLTIRPPSTN